MKEKEFPRLRSRGLHMRGLGVLTTSIRKVHICINDLAGFCQFGGEEILLILETSARPPDQKRGTQVYEGYCISPACRAAVG